ncbi:NUDIX domain-containing protein, partial [Candidatus Woesearchaeota archaeon]|nr:NUDIX domain-containing protein [Candidatus Woesearchaeota archaeon]
LIGKREKDPHIKKLTWCFPGGRPNYEEDLEVNLKYIIRTKTGLEADVKEIVFAKTYPEKKEFLSIYYLVEPSRGEEKPGENINELKWVKPTEVKRYFTTSLHPKVLEFLKSLS